MAVKSTEEIQFQLRLARVSVREERQVSIAAQRFRKIIRDISSSSKSKPFKGRGMVSSSPRPNLQRVAVRITYAQNKGNGQWGAHGKYLEREGGQKKDEKGVGFGSDGDEMKVSETLDRWQQEKDSHVFKIIISPEFGERMNLKKHCKMFVSQMEKDLGTELQWVAVDHHNTDNPHVHLTIRGVDAQKKALEISREYIKSGARQRAAEVATGQIGYRTDKDIKEALERQVTQKRFTEIDRNILKIAEDNIVTFDDSLPHSLKAREHQLNQIRRLSQLQTMGLAKKISKKSWSISPNLESALRQVQISSDRLKTLALHREMVSDPNAQFVATELKEPGEKLTGKVVGHGLTDNGNRSYILLEGIDGKIHYTTQSSQIEKKRGQGELKVGNIISLEAVKLKNGNTFIKAEDHGPTYSSQILDKAITDEKGIVAPKTSRKTFSGSFRHALLKRLELLKANGILDTNEDSTRILNVDYPAYDKLIYNEAGLSPQTLIDPKDKKINDPFLGEIVAKGQASVVIKTTANQLIMVSGEQIKEHSRKAGSQSEIVRSPEDENGLIGAASQSHLSLDSLRTGTTLLFSKSFKRDSDEPFHALGVVSSKNLKLKTDAKVFNQIDRIITQIPNFSESAPIKEGKNLSELVQKRVDVWRERGVDAYDPKFALHVHIWRRDESLQKESMETFERHKKHISDPNAKLAAPSLNEPGEKVIGKLVGHGLTKNHRRSYLLIESIDGKIHYATQSLQIEKRRNIGEFKRGNIVSLKSIKMDDGSTFVKASDHGASVSNRILDSVIFDKKGVPYPKTSGETFSGSFNHEVIKRIGALRESNIIETDEDSKNILKVNSLTYDRLVYKESSLTLKPIRNQEDGKTTQPFLGEVVLKGQASLVIKTTSNAHILVTAEEIKKLSKKFEFNKDKCKPPAPLKAPGQEESSESNLDLDLNSIRTGTTLLFSKSFRKGSDEPAHSLGIVSSKNLTLKTDAPEFNQIDRIISQVPKFGESAPIKDGKILSEIIQERASVWQGRGVNPYDQKFALQVHIWRKDNESRREEFQSENENEGLEISRAIAQPGQTVGGTIVRITQSEKTSNVIFESDAKLYSVNLSTAEAFKLKNSNVIRARYTSITDPRSNTVTGKWTLLTQEKTIEQQPKKKEIKR